MMWIIVLIVIGVVIFVVKAENNNATSENQSSTTSLAEVNNEYANEAFKFFDGYLCLCNKHSVLGVCHLHAVGKEQCGIATKMECIVSSIDNEHGDEAFNTLKMVWSQLRQEKMSQGDYSAVTYAGDGYIKKYFGCEDLHYVFTEADEYQFKNGQVIMSFNRMMFTSHGEKWKPTLLNIMQKVQAKWPNAKIDIGENGIIIKP